MLSDGNVLKKNIVKFSNDSLLNPNKPFSQYVQVMKLVISKMYLKIVSLKSEVGRFSFEIFNKIYQLKKL